MALDAEQLYEAARRIHAWRADPKVPVGCPACGKLGLAIVDRSARPSAAELIFDNGPRPTLLPLGEKVARRAG